jgi:preprotein translocase subunit SecA
MPVYLNALTGKGVHIVTVNDYLAKRDAEWMGRVHRFLGLTGGVGLSRQTMTPKTRRPTPPTSPTAPTTSSASTTCATTWRWSPRQVQRGHHFAIVDEVDSILIDEARTPLIISGPAADSRQVVPEFARIAPRLKAEEHYEVDEGKRHGDRGHRGGGRQGREAARHREPVRPRGNTPLIHHLQNALKAKELYQARRRVHRRRRRGQDRRRVHRPRARGSPLLRGLHQAIEAKEGVRIKEENQTLATITLQNYFRLYDKLAGMTGTAKTEAGRVPEIYKLGVVEVPTNRPHRPRRPGRPRSTRPRTPSSTPSSTTSSSATSGASRS